MTRPTTDDIANDVLHRAIYNRWQPTGRELADAYNINNTRTLGKVKRKVRKFAAESDVVWGYDPDSNTYKVAPHNDAHVFGRIVTYYHDNWNDAGKSLVHTVYGGHRMGYLTEQNKDDLVEFYEGVTKKVDEVRGFVLAATTPK